MERQEDRQTGVSAGALKTTSNNGKRKEAAD